MVADQKHIFHHFGGLLRKYCCIFSQISSPSHLIRTLLIAFRQVHCIWQYEPRQYWSVIENCRVHALCRALGHVSLIRNVRLEVTGLKDLRATSRGPLRWVWSSGSQVGGYFCEDEHKVCRDTGASI